MRWETAQRRIERVPFVLDQWTAHDGVRVAVMPAHRANDDLRMLGFCPVMIRYDKTLYLLTTREQAIAFANACEMIHTASRILRHV